MIFIWILTSKVWRYQKIFAGRERREKSSGVRFEVPVVIDLWPTHLPGCRGIILVDDKFAPLELTLVSETVDFYSQMLRVPLLLSEELRTFPGVIITFKHECLNVIVKFTIWASKLWVSNVFHLVRTLFDVFKHLSIGLLLEFSS